MFDIMTQAVNAPRIAIVVERMTKLGSCAIMEANQSCYPGRASLGRKTAPCRQVPAVMSNCGEKLGERIISRAANVPVAVP